MLVAQVLGDWTAVVTCEEGGVRSLEIQRFPTVDLVQVMPPAIWAR
jgi:hypothetical protein